MSETEMTEVYRKWATENIDPLREEIRGLRNECEQRVRENNLLRDMIVHLVAAYDESSMDVVIAGLDAEIEALRAA